MGCSLAPQSRGFYRDSPPFLLWPLLKAANGIDKSWSDPPLFRVFLVGGILFVLGWAVRRASIE
jgi:hypothetical protein